MTTVFDTNILSTFAKIDKLDLLKIVFKEQKLLIPYTVYKELLEAKKLGYEFVDKILDSKSFEYCNLSQEEFIFVDDLKKELDLGEGDMEAISISKSRNALLVTNDKKIKNFAEKIDVKVVDLIDILKFVLIENILLRKDLEFLIDEIENKDNIIIKNKELIFK